jgi:hypothetical protein
MCHYFGVKASGVKCIKRNGLIHASLQDGKFE